MNTFRSYIVGVLALLVLAGALSVAYYKGAIEASTSQAAALSAGAVVQVTPVVQPSSAGPNAPVPRPSSGGDVNDGTTPQTGAPAIVPTIKNAGPNTPAFTEADVRQFAEARNKGFGKIEVASGTASIEIIQFMTAAQLHVQTSKAGDLSVSNDALLCYVVYNGDFMVSSPLLNSKIKSFSFRHVMQVFDAHSGNLLTQSAYDPK